MGSSPVLPSTRRARGGLLRDTRGLGTVEYVILLCLVAVVGFAAWGSFGDTVRAKVAGSTATIAGLPEWSSAGAAVGASTTSRGGAEGSSGAVLAAPAAGGGAPAAAASSASDEGRGLLAEAGSFVYGVGAGVVGGAWGTVTGAVDLVTGVGGAIVGAARDPGRTWDSIRSAAADPAGTARAVGSTAVAVGRAAVDWGRGAVDTIRHGSWEERGRLLGAGAFEVASAGLLPAAKLGTIGRVAAHADDVADVARVAGRADDAADAARAAGRADHAADAARAAGGGDDAAAAAAMTRRARPTADELRRRSRELGSDDEIFDRVIAAADANGGWAPRDPGLVFTTIPSAALDDVMDHGLRSGRALGRQGPNAEVIWFGEGSPFYGEGVTLVMPRGRFEALGGRSSSGLHGQSHVGVIPHDRVPDGVPFDEFAVVESLGRGYVEPIYVPPGWTGPVGPRLPDPPPTP